MVADDVRERVGQRGRPHECEPHADVGAAQLLDHEQLHFDIAELAARRLRTRFEDFKDGCAEPGGVESIQAMVVEIDRELQEEQSRYDRETNHGADARTQDRWRRRVQGLLKKE